MRTCPDCGQQMTAIQYAYPHPDRYDGISEWVCVCGVRIGRWSRKRLADGETEPRYGERLARCGYADKYKAERAPTCGCVACMTKWREKNG